MLRQDFKDRLKQAMLGKDQPSVATIRLILAALKDRDIAARSKNIMDGIAEEEILQMLQSMIKQRRESISLYEQGGRLELAQQEKTEIEIIETFLPQQLSLEEMTEEIDRILSEIKATSIKEMGAAMALLRERFAGKMDFGKASQILKQRLSP